MASAKARTHSLLAGAARRTPGLRRVFDERARYAAEAAELRATLERTLSGAEEADGQEQSAVLAGLYPLGHFYSPIPDMADIRARGEQIFADRDGFPGIDLNVDAQLELARQLADVVQDQPFHATEVADLRYYFSNPYFGYGDGLVLHGLLRLWHPRRFIEVGSGFSSALVLDTNERYMDGSLQCTFIEPYPERLHSLLRDGDEKRVRIIEAPVQTVPIEEFHQLQAGDILFIDSSHVAKVGSDVNYLLLDVLPTLPPGVNVHVHDIVWPFEYQDWVYQGRFWNEAYLLRALLINNPRLAVTWFSNQLAWTKARHEVSPLLPIWHLDPGTSLWLRTC